MDMISFLTFAGIFIVIGGILLILDGRKIWGQKWFDKLVEKIENETQTKD